MMSRWAPLIVPALVLLLLPGVNSGADNKDDLVGQKRDLEQVRDEVNNSQRQLDSLKAVEMKILKQVSDYDQRISTNQKVIRRLNREAEQLRGSITAAEQGLSNRTVEHEQTERRYLGNIRQFYLAANKPVRPLFELPNEELETNRKIVYLATMAVFESDEVKQASQMLTEAVDELDQLSGERKKVAGLTRERETATSLEKNKKRKEEKGLEVLRRRKVAEADRIFMLRQAAEEMESIIARIEKRRSARSSGVRPSGMPSAFATLRGQLLAPMRGRVTLSYGNHTDKVTNLKSFAPGITIKGKSRASVTAVASGMVAYVGKLRGYGNFVIINHDDEYYTTYAGLGESNVVQDSYVSSGSKIANAGDDGVIKFELRLGSQPLDPIEWITIDAF